MTVLHRKRSRGRTLWLSGAGTPTNTLNGPRRMWPGPTSTEMTECRKSSRPFRCLCLGVLVFFILEISLIFFSADVQVGFSLLRPRGRVRSDREAETSYRQAQVSRYDSVAPVQVQSQTPCRAVDSWVRFLSVRCKESESPHAVTIYMLEPQICQYVLGVSSQRLNEPLHNSVDC